MKGGNQFWLPLFYRNLLYVQVHGPIKEGYVLKMIVGLGNPGKAYEETRHNMGFRVVDVLSERLSIPLDRNKFRALYGMGEGKGEKLF